MECSSVVTELVQQILLIQGEARRWEIQTKLSSLVLSRLHSTKDKGTAVKGHDHHEYHEEEGNVLRCLARYSQVICIPITWLTVLTSYW